MNKEFVTYEQAKILKEFGFDEPCFGYYYTLNGKTWQFAEKEQYYRLDDEVNIGGKFSLLAPLKQQVFRWFREKYKYHIVITNTNGLGKSKGFGYEISIQNSNDVIAEYGSIYVPDEPWLNTYEEAEDACIDKLIEIVKGDKNEK